MYSVSKANGVSVVLENREGTGEANALSFQKGVGIAPTRFKICDVAAARRLKEKVQTKT